MSAAGQCEWHLRWPIGARLSATRAAGKMAAAAAASVYEQLKELRCPLLDGVFLPEPGAALGLLCAPSAQRLELLAWLCARANPPLQEQFATLTESQTEEKTQEMAKLGSDLLLCRSDELDLIEGEASAERQLRFMEQLLDVIRYLDAITGTDAGDSTTSREESLRGAARKNEEFLREVFSSPSLPALLAPTLPPCTADIKPLLLEELAPHMRSRLSGRSSGKTLAELSRTLEEANAALERLRAESSSLRGDTDPLAPGTSLQTLALAACDSHQLMAAFRQVYETELREHCVRGPAPRLSPCGPLAQHLHQALTLCTQLPPGAAGAGPAERHLRARGADGGAETRRGRHQPPSDTACEDGGAAPALPGPPGRCRGAAGVTPGLGWERGEGWGAPGPPSHKGAAVPLFLG